MAGSSTCDKIDLGTRQGPDIWTAFELVDDNASCNSERTHSALVQTHAFASLLQTSSQRAVILDLESWNDESLVSLEKQKKTKAVTFQVVAEHIFSSAEGSFLYSHTPKWAKSTLPFYL
jgi:hypothetical protein